MGQPTPRGAYTASPCRSCRKPKPVRHYLCGNCWALLTPDARRALNVRDGQALARLRQLHAHIDSGLPLADLEITS